MTNRHILRHLLPAGAMLIIAACALSPQTITIRPVLDSTGVAGAAGQRLWVEVRDTRRDPVMGYRGGVYDTASISTSAETAASIRSELASAYRALGYNVTERDSPQARKLVVEIDQLRYTTSSKKLLQQIEIFASIRTSARSGTREVTTRFQDRVTRDYAKPPSTEQNEALINEVFSKLLQRMLEDPGIAELIRG